MNFGMIGLLGGNHISEIRRQAGRLRTGPSGHGPSPASGSAGRAPLRSRIGFVLVEVGLHLQATAGLQAAGSRT